MRSDFISAILHKKLIGIGLILTSVVTVAQTQTPSSPNPNIDQLLAASQSKDSDTRASAITALGKMGDGAKSAVPQLIEALKDSDEWVRSAAANTLGQIGVNAKASIPQLVEVLRDPNRVASSNAAYALGQMGDTAKSAVPNLIEAFKNRENWAAARTLAKFGIEAVIPILKAAPSIDNLCQAFCDLVNTTRNGVLKSLKPDTFHATVPVSNQVTLDRLDALFVIKSTPLCPLKENKKFLNQILGQITKVASSSSSENSSQLEEFSSLKIYDAQFKMQIFKEFISHNEELGLNQTNLSELNKKLQEVSKVAAQQFGKYDGVGGSAMVTYAQACHLIHLKAGTRVSCPPSSEALTQLKKAVQRDPIRLPYQLSDESGSESTKSSAARAIPSNLAMYLIDTPARATHSQSLFLALKNYHQHIGVLVAHTIFYPESHNGDQEGIAPYYFYSTIPYAMSSLELLQNEGTLSKEQKDELSKISDQLNTLLLKLLDQDKGQMIGQSPFLTDNGIYHSSPRYVTALGGLALIPLLAKKCGDKKESLGILSGVDILGIDHYLTSDNQNSKDTAGHQ